MAGELSADPETPASLVSPSRKRVSKMKTDKQKDERQTSDLQKKDDVKGLNQQLKELRRKSVSAFWVFMQPLALCDHFN